MKLANKIETLLEKKIDFSDIEKGLLADLSKLDKKAATTLDKKYGMEQVWGVSGSPLNDPDLKKFKKEVLKMFPDAEAVEKVLAKWSYDYSELKDGTQPW